MLVARRHGRVRPAHHAHDCSLRNAEQEQHRGCGVPGVVEPAVTDACPVEELLPVRPVRSRIQRRAGRTCEDPAAGPELCRLDSLPVLFRAVRAKQLDELVGESDTTPTGARLGLRCLVAQRDPARAVAAELALPRPVAAVLPARA